MSIKKLNGKWECRYYVRNTDGELRFKIKKGFALRSDAENWEINHKHESNLTDSTLFSTVFEGMTAANQANSITTATRKQRLMDYAADLWSKPMKRLTKAVLIRWRENLEKTDLATVTKNDIIGYVKAVFRYGYEVYDLYDSAKILKPFKATLNDYHEMTIINYDQLQQMLACDENQDVIDMFTLLYMTGMRIGEARALYKADFDGSQIHIYKSMRRYEASLKEPKTPGSNRYVPLDDSTIAMLQKRMKRKGKYLIGDYAPLSLTLLHKHLKQDLVAANLPHMRMHDFRHSHVSLLWANHVPIPEISKRIGHSSPYQTMRTYSHIFDVTQTSSLNVLNSLKNTKK